MWNYGCVEEAADCRNTRLGSGCASFHHAQAAVGTRAAERRWSRTRWGWAADCGTANSCVVSQVFFSPQSALVCLPTEARQRRRSLSFCCSSLMYKIWTQVCGENLWGASVNEKQELWDLTIFPIVYGLKSRPDILQLCAEGFDIFSACSCKTPETNKKLLYCTVLPCLISEFSYNTVITCIGKTSKPSVGFLVVFFYAHFYFQSPFVYKRKLNLNGR